MKQNKPQSEFRKTINACIKGIKYGTDILTPSELNRIDIALTDIKAAAITLAIVITIFLIAANY
jgi:hypothetical protein